MSSDHVLGTATVVGTGAGGLAAFTHDRNAWFIGISIGLIVLILLGLFARRFNKRA